MSRQNSQTCLFNKQLILNTFTYCTVARDMSTMGLDLEGVFGALQNQQPLYTLRAQGWPPIGRHY